MKKTINRKVYDTETATTLGQHFVGYFGQEAGYEERLLVTKTGNYFIYGIGGGQSKYSEPTIVPLTNEQADAWKRKNNA